jgi:hypothetical protein
MTFKDIIKLKHFNFSLLLFLFAVLYLWRPFFLGFYADDWNYILEYKFFLHGDDSPFSFQNLNYYMGQLGNRPLTALTYYIGYSIFGVTNTIGWHFYATFLFATSIYTFRLAYSELFKFIGVGNSQSMSELPAALFISAPWILSVNTWLSASMSQPSITFFCLFTYLIFKGYNCSRSYYFLTFLFLLFSLLYYESFYLQWLVILSIVFIFRKPKSIAISSIYKYLSLALTAQLLSIIWNRYSNLFFENLVVKNTNPYIFQTFIANLISLPYAFISSFLLGSIIIIPILFFLFFQYVKSVKSNEDKSISILLPIILLLGIFISLIIFSGAGYSVWGLGMRSRTFISMNYYIVLLISLLIMVPANKSIINKKTTNIITLLIVSIFSIYSFCNSLDWVQSWNMQKKVFTNLPNNKINLTDRHSLILLSDDIPFKHNWVSVFDAQWAVNTQMNYGNLVINGVQDTSLMPHQNRRFSIAKSIIHTVNHKYYVNMLKGDSLFQFYKDSNIRSSNDHYYTHEFAYKLSDLYILYNNNLKFITNDTIIQFKPIKNYDYWITYLYNKYIKKNI